MLALLADPKITAIVVEHRDRRLTLHKKKRRLATLQAGYVAMVADDAHGTVRIAFGSKKLFHAQFDLAANRYRDHAA